MSKQEALKKNQIKTYIFKLEEDPLDDGQMAYHAYCPSLKGCHTWAKTKEEVLKNIHEAVQCQVEAMIKNGESIPVEELEPKESFVISTPNIAITLYPLFMPYAHWTEQDLKKLKLLK